MGVIHIEDIDEQVMKSLRLRARINGRSLEDEVRALLAEAARPRMTPEERTERAKRIRAMTRGWSPETDSVFVIREIRDR
jgi:plasmid stability protein